MLQTQKRGLKVALFLAAALVGASPATATASGGSDYWTAAAAATAALGDAGQLSGGISVSADGTTVSGVLPPGYTKDNPPLDPDKPDLAAKIRHARDTSNLHTLPADPVEASRALKQLQANRLSVPRGTKANRLRATPASKSFAYPCTTEISRLNSNGIYYKGQMSGCLRTTLRMHTYMNVDGVRHQDGFTKSCSNSTGCSVIDVLFSEEVPHCEYFTNYAHGSSSRDGDMYAWNRRVCPYA